MDGHRRAGATPAGDRLSSVLCTGASCFRNLQPRIHTTLRTASVETETPGQDPKWSPIFFSLHRSVHSSPQVAPAFLPHFPQSYPQGHLVSRGPSLYGVTAPLSGPAIIARHDGSGVFSACDLGQFCRARRRGRRALRLWCRRVAVERFLLLNVCRRPPCR